MAGLDQLVAPALMGALLVAVVAWTARTGQRRSRADRDTAAAEDGGSGPGALVRSVRSPTAWAVGYVLLAVVLGGVAGIAAEGASLVVALVGVFGVLILGYVGYGTYSAARSRGLTSAQAALIGGWVLGLLGIAGIAANLFLG